MAGCLFTLLRLPLPAHGQAWINQVQVEMTCLGQGSPAEVRELSPRLISPGAAANQVVAYFAMPIGHDRTRAAHVTLLASLAFFADTDNDQALRSEFLADLERTAAEGRDRNPLFAQVERCARAWRISASVEQGDQAAVIGHTRTLLGMYASGEAGPSYEDLPLLQAMRELLVPGPLVTAANARTASPEAMAELTTFLEQRGETVGRRDLERGSRLFAAVAAGRLALGDLVRARAHANRSLEGLEGTDWILAAWRVFPTFHDLLVEEQGIGPAAAFARNFSAEVPFPDAFSDNELEYEILVRKAEAAEYREEYEEWGELFPRSRQALIDQRRLRVSIPRFREGLVRTLFDDNAAMHAVIQRDPAWAEDTWVNSYREGAANLIRQAQNLFQPHARERMFLAYRIDSHLQTMSLLYEVLPRHQAEIRDVAFQLAQIRTFSRVMPATTASLVREERLGPEARERVSRFLAMQARYSLGLRNLHTILQGNGDGSYSRSAGRQVFITLDVLREETGASMERYVAAVRQDAPQLAEYLTPNALPLQRVVGLLSPGEVLVSTLVTHEDLFVFALSREQTVFRRAGIPGGEVSHLVQELRQSLAATSAGGTLSLPAFHAGAAHALYRATLGQVEDVLAGATHLLWHGHGPLAAVPPAVLVVDPPPAERMADAARLSRLVTPVDRFAISALTDVTVLPSYRGEARRVAQRSEAARDFVGIGAPLMSPDELRERNRARSFELAGGLSMANLAELPKLPEAAEELRRLEELFGSERSTVLLGPAASKSVVGNDVLGGARILVFATHGFTSGEIEGLGEPSLLMALPEGPHDPGDAVLTATEIASLNLSADLVVLSACNTAAADGRPDAETFTGLGQAFLYAGARSLLLAHWAVASNASADLSVGLLEESRDRGQSLAEGLRTTMLRMREEGTDHDIEAHPFFWGPFVLVGDGASPIDWGPEE